MNFAEELENRIADRSQRSLLDVKTRLEHFSLISYKVPISRIEHLIPSRFKLWTFKTEGIEYALVSAVPFMDTDFSFYRIFKYPKFKFYQTNFRTYVIDQETGKNCAWFFGTTLGSLTSLIPKLRWKMPWQYGSFKFQFELNKKQYLKYEMEFKSKQGAGIANIKSSKNEMKLLEGFKSIDEQYLILTHPVTGYYFKRNKSLGTYDLWHPKMELFIGEPINLYFELFENLGLLTRDEMQAPHSILITPSIDFDILLPPREIVET